MAHSMHQPNSLILQKNGVSSIQQDSSPCFPQSNGEAERAVETTKSLLRKEKDPPKGLLAYRSTPLACGYSPSELLIRRKLRNTIPTFHTVLNPSWPDMDKLREREAGSKETQKLNFNQRHNAITLRSVQPGTPVHIKDMGTTGTIAGAAETPRWYLVKTENGTVRRNRSHVNPIPNPMYFVAKTMNLTKTLSPFVFLVYIFQLSNLNLPDLQK